MSFVGMIVPSVEALGEVRAFVLKRTNKNGLIGYPRSDIFRIEFSAGGDSFAAHGLKKDWSGADPAWIMDEQISVGTILSIVIDDAGRFLVIEEIGCVVRLTEYLTVLSALEHSRDLKRKVA